MAGIASLMHRESGINDAHSRLRRSGRSPSPCAARAQSAGAPKDAMDSLEAMCGNAPDRWTPDLEGVNACGLP
jgi:hypothetical protein